MMQTRRGFLGLALCTAGGACLSRTGTVGDGESYSVALLGDTHFDSTDTKYYHSEYLFSTSKARDEAHLQEHVRNAEMWRERIPLSSSSWAISCRETATTPLRTAGCSMTPSV